MSPASKSKSKSKSKDKPAAKASKEPQKSIKPSASSTAGSGSSASAYNPTSGTFHTLETTAIASSPSANINGRFRNIDETDDLSGSSHGTINEYDTISNNGSSVDLDDLKEKIANTTLRQETVPGADNDKREKIRIKNEKKHQRQKEKRAQELHERCCGYIMSRKLEVLSQQLVAMGFTAERATLALILNEGKVEESVSWLFEGEEASQNKYANVEASGCLKIDITAELARIEAMEIKYKCLKQDVERAAVASEGDLEKAEEALKTQKRETPITSPKLDEAVDSRNLPTQQERPMGSVLLQQRRNERDFNYTKATGGLESVNKNPIPVKLNQPKPPIMEKNSWPVNGSMNLSASYSVAPPVHGAPPPAKMDSRHSLIGHDVRTVKQSMVREPVIMMQRPQSINAKSNSISNGMSPYPVTSNGWYPNTALNFDNIKMNQNMLQNHNMGSYITENPSAQRFFNQPGDLKQHQTMINPVEIQPSPQMGSSWNPMGNLSSSSLTPPASLGLFSSHWGSLGSLNNPSSSHLDWNTGGSSMSQCDYTNIDWRVETSSSPSSRLNGMRGGVSSLLKNNGGQGMLTRHNINSTNGVYVTEAVVREQEAASAPSGGLLEWTNPFAGQDMFSVPRQFVSSP